MEVSGIDEDLEYIVNFLNRRGYRPFASCDGVHAHHQEGNKPVRAYLGFLESEKIEELISLFMRDKDTFSIVFGNSSNIEPYELYGNEIDGNFYQVNFKNVYGEKTTYFNHIIEKFEKGEIKPDSGLNLKSIHEISQVLRDVDTETGLNFTINLNDEYQPFMHREGRVNYLNISTKGNAEDTVYNLSEFTRMLSEEYGFPLKEGSLDEEYSEDNFIVADRYSMRIVMKDFDPDKIKDIIKKAVSKEYDFPLETAKYGDYDEYLASFDDDEGYR